MDFSKLRKLESSGARPPAEPKGLVTAIVKVRVPGYRPADVRVRSDIEPRIFTAELQADALAKLEADPNVESVSISRPIPLQKLPTD